MRYFRIPKGPPRPGLIPQSGDPNKPYRWIRPEDGKRNIPTNKEKSITPKQLTDELNSLYKKMMDEQGTPNPELLKQIHEKEGQLMGLIGPKAGKVESTLPVHKKSQVAEAKGNIDVVWDEGSRSGPYLERMMANLVNTLPEEEIDAFIGDRPQLSAIKRRVMRNPGLQIGSEKYKPK